MEAPANPSDPTRRSSPWWLLPLGLLALGMVMAAWGCTTAVQEALPLFTDEPVDGTSGVDRDLAAGTWAVYADMPLDFTRVSVTSASGESLVVSSQPAGVSETISRQNAEFRAIARFEVVDAGVHRIDLAPDGLASVQILVGPPVLEVFSVSGRAAALLVGGLFLTLGGIVMWFRRTRSNR